MPTPSQNPTFSMSGALPICARISAKTPWPWSQRHRKKRQLVRKMQKVSTCKHPQIKNRYIPKIIFFWDVYISFKHIAILGILLFLFTGVKWRLYDNVDIEPFVLAFNTFWTTPTQKPLKNKNAWYRSVDLCPKKSLYTEASSKWNWNSKRNRIVVSFWTWNIQPLQHSPAEPCRISPVRCPLQRAPCGCTPRNPGSATRMLRILPCERVNGICHTSYSSRIFFGSLNTNSSTSSKTWDGSASIAKKSFAHGVFFRSETVRIRSLTAPEAVVNLEFGLIWGLAPKSKSNQFYHSVII